MFWMGKYNYHCEHIKEKKNSFYYFKDNIF